MSPTALPSSLETPYGSLSVAFDGPPTSAVLVVLAHGAGAGMHSDFMTSVARGLAEAGSLVCRFNFPYLEQGRKTPDRQPLLEASWTAVVEGLGEVARNRSLVIGGKSLGGRIASHVATPTSAAGVLLLGYPLHPPGRPERLRAAHLSEVDVPMLFVAGTRDPFCPLPTLREVLDRLSSQARIEVIDDGDHSFKVRRSSGRTTQQAWREVADVSARWIDELIERRT